MDPEKGGVNGSASKKEVVAALSARVGLFLFWELAVVAFG